MKNLKIVLVIVAGTALAMLVDTHGPIGSRIYPSYTVGVAQPEGVQMPIFMLGTLAQAAGAGVALALLTQARAIVRALDRVTGGRRGLAVASFVSLLWILGSWVPHVSLHQAAAPDNLWALAGIEWGFHVTVVLAACVLARFAFVAARITSEDARPTESAHAAAQNA